MLVDDVREAGTYTIRWDGRDDKGRELASGVYLVVTNHFIGCFY